MSAKIISNITLKISRRQLLQIYYQDLCRLDVKFARRITRYANFITVDVCVCILLTKCLELSKKYLLCINNVANKKGMIMSEHITRRLKFSYIHMANVNFL